MIESRLHPNELQPFCNTACKWKLAIFILLLLIAIFTLNKPRGKFRPVADTSTQHQRAWLQYTADLKKLA